MKFLTMRWWCGEDSTDDAVERYELHYRGLEGVPNALHRLHCEVGLHDAHLLRMENACTGQLVLFLDGLSREEERVPMVLTYSGVVGVLVSADPDVGLPGPHGFGDLGYDEIDVTSDGVIEHRLLFSSGIEMVITFRQFAFTMGAAAQPAAPTNPACPHP
jgi:hypothetical protein